VGAAHKLKPKPYHLSLGPFRAGTTHVNSISKLTCSVIPMPTARSYTWAEASQITLTIKAKRAQSTSTISENPQFMHHYPNPPPNMNITPPTNPMSPAQCPLIPVRRCIADPPRGHIEELPEEPPESPRTPVIQVITMAGAVRAT
jgi:hypothetical protein